jgi:hypothetical protein
MHKEPTKWRTCSFALFRGNREPTLNEILAEPIVRAVMQRDGVDEGHVRQLMERATTRPAATEHQWITISSDDDSDDPPLPTPGAIAKARVIAAWPRVFPSL